MSGPDIISFIFRIINVLILAFLFTYIAKKYLYPVLKEQLVSSLAFLKKLKDRINFAKKRQETLDHDFVEQQEETRVLLEKVKLWRSAVIRRKDKYDYEVGMRLETIKSLRQKQEQHHSETLELRVLIPQAFHQANIVLTHEYRHDEKKGKQTLDEIIKFVEQK